MDKQKRYTLGKNERLKSRKSIDELFISGKSFSLFPFKIIYKTVPQSLNPATGSQNLQAAFSVSKKYFKKATQRNRIKRLMREAWRLQKHDLQHTLQQINKQANVFILYVGNEVPDYTTAVEKINAAIKKLQRIIHEEPVGNM